MKTEIFINLVPKYQVVEGVVKEFYDQHGKHIENVEIKVSAVPDHENTAQVVLTEGTRTLVRLHVHDIVGDQSLASLKEQCSAEEEYFPSQKIVLLTDLILDPIVSGEKGQSVFFLLIHFLFYFFEVIVFQDHLLGDEQSESRELFYQTYYISYSFSWNGTTYHRCDFPGMV